MYPILPIVLADDHPVILMGLAAVIGQFPRQQTVAQTHGGHGLIQVLTCISRNVIVTDYNLGDEFASSGMQLLARLRQQCPGCGIVVCTMVRNPALLHAMQQIDVACIISKDDGFTHAGHAVMAAVCGTHYDSLHILEELGLGPNNRNESERPNARRREVLRLCAVGVAISDIAQMLDPSMKAVSARKAVALRKLGLVRKIDPFRCARANGLIVPH